MEEASEIAGELFPELRDPNHISDADFFGVWNEQDENWSAAPILRYDKFSGLGRVLMHAKKGEYEKAKEALRDYFKNRSGVPVYAPKVRPETFLAAELMKEKCFSFLQIDSCVGKTQVPAEWGYVTAELSTLAAAYFLFDADMDGSFAEVFSRRHPQNRPAVLEVEAGGKTLVFPAAADTYISAGENRDKNFGAAQTLLVREAAGAPDLPIGSETARAYFRFDVPDQIGDVTAIRLKFYARSSAGTKTVFVINPQNEARFEEDQLTWSAHYPQVFNFKQTGYIWKEGERLPDSHEKQWGVEYEWLNFVTRLYPAGWCVSKYIANCNVQCNAIYAYRALELELSMYTAKKSGVYPRILEGGWRTEYLLEVFFGTMDSPFATPEVLTAQLKYMVAHLTDLKDVAHAAANWESAIRVGFARIAAYVPEITPAGWWDYAKNRLVELFSRNTLTPGGAYMESCSGYIAGVVEELKLCLQLVEQVDGREDESYQKLFTQYRRLTNYYFNMAMNCGCTLPWGDGGRNDIREFARRENAFCPNPQFEYFATKGASGEEPDYYSVNYPDKAIAFLRSDWEPEGFSAMIHTDFGGNHAHFDDLSLDVCAYGSLLLVDSGITSYSPGSKMADTARRTISHNTIEIDGADQLVKRGGKPGEAGIPQMLTLSTNRLFDFVEAGSRMIYPGFDVTRRVLFLHNAFWIVSDDIAVEDARPHTYRQSWHPDVKNGLTLDAVTKAAVTHFEQGANLQIVPADPESLEAELARGYMAHPVFREIESDSVRYVRKNAVGAQTFDTVLYPVRDNENVPVRVRRIELGQAEAAALELKAGEHTGFYYCSNEQTPSRRRFGEFETDGRMAYAALDANGAISVVALANAKTLKQGGVTLVSCQTAPDDLGAEWDEAGVKLFSQCGSLSDYGVRIYSARPTAAVTLNGKKINFIYENHMVTLR